MITIAIIIIIIKKMTCDFF